MKDFRRSFGEYLTAREITQSEASERLGISQQAVSTLLNSETTVRPSTKNRIFKEFPDFRLIYEGNGSFSADGSMAGKVIAPSNLDVVLYIENNIAEFIKLPEFMKMVYRVTKEFGFYEELRREIEDIKRKINQKP